MDLFALLGVVVVNADLTKWISLVLSGGGVAGPCHSGSDPPENPIC